MSHREPTEAPPAYSSEPGHHGEQQEERAVTPIPLDDDERLSIEDDERPLPSGWVRQFDSSSNHNFFVDTKANPPRSIWIHPYFDEQFRRERPRDLPEEYRDVPDQQDSAKGHSQSPGKRGFGERIKDKLTGSTHDEREKKRAQRREAERQYNAMVMQRHKEMMERRRQMMAQQPMYGPPSAAYGRSRYGYGGGYGRYGGGMGMGLPIMGGLGGGLLLGSAMDGGFGGDFGGGGMDGGGGGC